MAGPTQVTVIQSGPIIRIGIIPPSRIMLHITSAGVRGLPGPPGTGINLVIGETPTGLINGSNNIFTTAFNFVPGHVSVYRNGIRQKLPFNFTTSGTTTITLGFAPTSGEDIQVDYEKGA